MTAKRERAAAMYTLIVTAKLNDVDPQAWLADALARIAELAHTRVHELPPWNWKAVRHQTLPHRPALTSRSVFELPGPAGADLTSRGTRRMGTDQRSDCCSSIPLWYR